MKACDCPFDGCGRTLSTRYNLKKHIEAHHLNIRPFECGKCHRTFSYKHSLKHHYLLHLPVSWEQLQEVVTAQIMEIPKLTSLLAVEETTKKAMALERGGIAFLRLPKIKASGESETKLPNIF